MESNVETWRNAFDQMVHQRRAIRIYHPSDYDPNAVTRSLERAVLAPSSSNMQLWEFYRVSDPKKKAILSDYCMGQNTTKTAQEIIVVVVRLDKWKHRAQSNLDFVKNTVGDRPSFKGQSAVSYYSKLMPLLYNNDRMGIRGFLKKCFVFFRGLKRPMVREVSGADVRVIAHKSVALAAQTFKLSMTAEGHDTCPVEGFDSVRIKKWMNLPHGAEINMIITCGKRVPEGIYNERFRVPMNEVVFEF